MAALSGKLRLEARGAIDGAAERPGEHEATRPSAELDVEQTIAKLWDRAVTGVKRAHEGMRGRHAALTVETEVDTLAAAPGGLGVNLREIARAGRDRLLEAHERVCATRAALRAFQTREDVTRPPRSGSHALVKLAILAIAALIELIVNASIFAGGDAFGFLGAVTKVLVVPIANIGGCFLWTHWLARLVLSRGAGKKAVGVFGCLVTLVWLIGLNLAVAHWRDAADILEDPNGARLALAGTWRTPLDLRSFQSWGLFLIGCFAGVAAIVEAWTWTDPLPGYGALERQVQAAAASFRDTREAAVEALRLETEAASNHLGEARRIAEVALAQRPDLAARAASLAEDTARYARHLAGVGASLVRGYREANLRARRTPPPSTFAEPPTFDLPLPELAILTDGTPSSTGIGQLAAAIDAISLAHAEACAALPALNELEAAGTPAGAGR